MSELQWQCDKRTFSMDSTMAFGVGYDDFGLENLWQEAQGKASKYLIWPEGKQWRLYDDADGGLAMYESQEAAKEAANRWEAAHLADAAPEA